MKLLLYPIENCRLKPRRGITAIAPWMRFWPPPSPRSPRTGLVYSSALPGSPAKLKRSSLLSATLTGYSAGRLGENRSNSLGYTLPIILGKSRPSGRDRESGCTTLYSLCRGDHQVSCIGTPSLSRTQGPARPG